MFKKNKLAVSRSLWNMLYIICLLPTVTVYAQKNKPSDIFLQKMQIWEDSLKHLSVTIYNHPEDIERKNANNLFVRTLVQALKIPHSFDYRFDSLKTLSIKKSTDNKFRTITWHLCEADGTFRYYGAIQFNTSELQLIPLLDMSDFMKSPMDSIVTHKQWYGARYYDIISLTDSKNNYYVLLGWKGSLGKTSKKVIEVLHFENGKPIFGLPIFENKKRAKRVIFEFAQQASMLLKYLPEKQMIVFDHLVPPDSRSEGMYEVYVPDLSYDGYQILPSGKLKFLENLDLRNQSDISDTQFIDPSKSNHLPAKNKLAPMRGGGE